MSPLDKLRNFVEINAFGVCTWLGEKFKIQTSVIRLFFIYSSFLAIGSPVIIYMILAFWIKMKNHLIAKRSSVWDL
ncbi:MAG: PspC domain-containing protein [Bacteroidetes bacterium]|nr:MAG: PspC domain-containing protein [Bacteroidota bacterium]REK05302.1 MAG: PspC domain-containing protein [Bacteroidota bacterium]REK32707.1 MAG: PspC domain-containing protein [Bacteroidota bacterium]REK48846.1 MAG: PspC domain-containing protein [Bacteroidota bacterium]